MSDNEHSALASGDDGFDDSLLAESIEVVDALDFDAVDEFFEGGVADVAAEAAAASEPLGEDPFVRFVGLVAEAARAAGAMPAVLSVIPALFGLRRIDHGHDAPMRSARETMEAHAWMSVLRGDEHDLGRCGSLPLDEWAAQLVSHEAQDAALAPALRRELRRRGVVAFGLLAA